MQFQNRRAVSEVMESRLVHADFLHQLLEVLVDGGVTQMISQFVGEHQIVFVLPRRASGQSPLLLFPLLSFQDSGDRGRDGNHPVFPVLGLVDEDVALARPVLLQLAADADLLLGEIHVLPLETENLRLAHPSEEIHDVYPLIGIALDDFQKIGNAVVHEGFQFRLLGFGQLGVVCRILRDDAGEDGLFQGTVQDAMDILDGFRRQRLMMLGLFAEQVDEALDLHRCQCG